MRAADLAGKTQRQFRATTTSQPNQPMAPNPLDRQFTVEQPDPVYVGDVTPIHTQDGWLYLAVVIDLFSRQVVGWSMAAHRPTKLCVQALQIAFWRRKPPPGLLHHSDRSSQYASREYRAHLAIMGMQQSMSRQGHCWDTQLE
jgi:putative transposase